MADHNHRNTHPLLRITASIAMSGTPYQNHRHHRRWVQFIATFMPAGQRAARRSRHRQARFPRPGDLLVQVQFRLGLPQQRPCLQLRQATCRRQQARRGTPDPSHTVRFKPVNQITTSTNAFRCKRSDTSGDLLSLDPTHHHVDFRLPHSEQASRSPRSRIGWSAPRRCVSWAVRLDPRIHSMPSRYVPGLANPEVPFASSSEGDFDDRESDGLSSGEPGWPRQ